MVQAPSVAALHELKTHARPGQQLALLRLIKNDIVGHLQRKEVAVRHGLLDCLARVLADSADHDVQLQATLIVGSLANGGAAFVGPILASNVVQPLLLALPPAKSPNKLVTASLRALNSLALAWLRSQSPHPSFLQSVFSKATVGAFLHILRQPMPYSHQHLHISLTATLVSTCCAPQAAPRAALVKAGVLDALASLLADHALALNRSRDPHLDLASILGAVSAIVRDSPYRAHRLVFSPDLRRIFSDPHDYEPLESIQIPNFNQHRRPSNLVPVDGLLPKVMAPLQKSVSFNSHSKIFSDQALGPISSPLCTWLMYLARSQQDPASRLAALRLLAILNDALDTDVALSRFDTLARSRERERQTALFAIPIAVKLVQDALDAPPGQESVLVKEEACSVLARLIENNSELQKAALDAGAVKHVSQLFRKSFDPIPGARPMWSANLQDSNSHVPATPSTTLGDGGLPQEVLHAMKCRAGALEALAAIAEKEDANRKAVIDSGIVPNLIDSLAPFTVSESSTVPLKNGNDVPVLLAACRAATAMSRSVSLLRTSLIDAGIVKPVFALLKYPDLAVQIAATNVTCNLVLDFSPMRQDLINAGVVRTLCEHAKRPNPKLRQSSLWALKHLVLNAPQSTKHTCLEELGPGWLIQAIAGNQRESQTSPPLTMGTSNAAGEQVNLLNAPDTPDMDVDWIEQEQQEQEDEEDNDDDDDDDDGEIMLDDKGTRYQHSGLRSTLESVNYKARLRLLRENEQNPAIQAKQDDMLVQEQALDFIRNLINGDDNVSMIDHLNDVIGADRIFDILYSKLKPISGSTSSPHGARQPAHQPQISQSNAVWQPPELINAALGVMVHLAGGSSKHRQQLIAQKGLLANWLPHFSHHDRRIRVASVWAVINLTWVENSGDREDAKNRALELRAVGIDEKVRLLVNDPDLDTRERVKTALRQIDELIDWGRYR